MVLVQGVAWQANMPIHVQVQVLAATRIHNRHLRVQFAKQARPAEDFEYLFFCDPTGVFVTAAGRPYTDCSSA